MFELEKKALSIGRAPRALLLGALFLLALAAPAAAAPSDPDLTLGEDGSVLDPDVGSPNDSGGGLGPSYVQDDGKTLVAFGVGGGEWVVNRYTAAGERDATFGGGDGQVILTPPRIGEIAAPEDIVPLPGEDGKYIIAGSLGFSSEPFNESFTLARLNEDGAPDASFSDDGYVDIRSLPADGCPGPAFTGDGVTPLSDGSYAAYGSQGGCGLFARVSSAGTVVQRAINRELPSGTAMGVSEGKPVVLGSTQAYPNSDASVARFNLDGTLDTSFSGDGVVTAALNQGDDRSSATDLKVQDDGAIVIAAERFRIFESGDGPQLEELGGALARFDSEGSPDAAFGGGDGTVTGDFPAGALGLDDVGRILTSSGLGDGVRLARFGADGVLDPTFDPSGTGVKDDPASEAGGGARGIPGAIGVGSNGRITIAASVFVSGPAEFGFGIGRYVGGEGTAPVDSDGDGRFDPNDNCPAVANPGQADADGDGTGDACDSTPNGDPTAPSPPPPPADADSDGVPNASDACPTMRGPAPSGCPPAPVTPMTPFVPSVKTPKVGGSSSAGAVRVSRKGAFTLPRQTVDCTGTGPVCSVKTVLVGNLPARASRKVRLGGSRFKVTAGKKGKVRIKLTRKGGRLLARRGTIKAKVVITVRRGDKTTKKTVTVKLKAPKKRTRR